ncbi:hypothetical protein J5N97_014289 [Dioscorea zingiberensis]|uniref:Disease resistance protein RGA3 n=1 Tax=Dioscorea zingiberensis TaxID=325984 RepID=A0A9D5CS27_9LILI|nr:hypothetical protein J5N97_014289 [Dioscorea zingiberensis]
MAMIVDAIVGKILERVTGLVEEKAIMVLGVKDELQKLQRTMKRIGLLLKDAEKKSIEDESIKDWIAELKDLMYDADDIIDRCMHEGTKILQDEQDHDDESSASQMVCCKLPLFCSVQSLQFRHAIANDIKSLNGKLEEVYKAKDLLHLLPSRSHMVDTTSRAADRHSSSLVEFDVVGFEIRDSTRTLVESLIDGEEEKCHVFSIVGMGGIGKTTLAQSIFNNPKIKNNFLLHSWSCVSKLSEPDLLKEIIRNCDGRCGESTTINELQRVLRDTIYGKHLFLVLDDVWDSNKCVDLLRNPVESGATKVRVLVTTRDENVARKLGSVHIHNVNKLTTESGWELLCKKVFAGRNLEDMQSLRDIGMQIVEKCDGLPLAIKTIAGVLITKDHNQKEWKRVLDNSAWNTSGLPEELHRALYISYEALSSPLRRCFLHCSLCPVQITSYVVIREWIAEGYIKEVKNELMEEIAEDYYKELIKRSLIQPKPEIADESVCTMHDSLRTLAEVLGQDENLGGDPQEAVLNSTTTKLRRLLISSTKDAVSLPQIISNQKCLRTLLLTTPPTLEMDVIMSFSLLRVLRLNGHMINHLPNEIGDLVHLRLLDLDDTTLQELPDSLGRLTNLQFLTLINCKVLQTLPKSITKLCNLRCLDLEYSSVNHLPKGIGKLEKLNNLQGFVTGDGVDSDGHVKEGCNFGELQSLDKLRDLHLKELERATDGSSVLSSKKSLQILRLHCTPQSFRNDRPRYTEEAANQIEKFFSELCPPSCLERLDIDGFFGSRYPRWMASTSIHTYLVHLKYLQLLECTSCPRLPSLGQLPNLKFLKIVRATAVVSIGAEFLGSGVKQGSGKPPTAFPKLEDLHIWSMYNWEEWSLDEEENEVESSRLLIFPRLQRLGLQDCPKLKALPRSLSHTHIQRLYINDVYSMETVEDIPTLSEKLNLRNNQCLSRISNLPAVKILSVCDCLKLNCVEKLDSLQSLELFDHESNSLPEWLINFLQEKQHSFDDQFVLYLEITVEALKGCLRGSPAWSVLEQVPRVTAYANVDNESKYLYYTNETSSYDTNLHEE